MLGRIHSFESFGTVDGPGIRFVIFMQGCNFKCLYCHNPDTWNINGGNEYTIEQVFNKIKRYKPYFKTSGGGVTVSGGEPLLQMEFVSELFKKCKEDGIHTAIDTNGFLGDHLSYRKTSDPDSVICSLEEICQKPEINNNLQNLLEFTDLVLLDIKHINTKIHKKLTGQPNQPILEFAKYLDKIKKTVWLRYVVVPGFTDDETELKKLGEFIKGFSNIEKIELLSFHKAGEYKWKDLNLQYSLSNVPPANDEDIKRIKSILNKHDLIP